MVSLSINLFKKVFKKWAIDDVIRNQILMVGVGNPLASKNGVSEEDTQFNRLSAEYILSKALISYNQDKERIEIDYPDIGVKLTNIIWFIINADDECCNDMDITKKIDDQHILWITLQYCNVRDLS